MTREPFQPWGSMSFMGPTNEVPFVSVSSPALCGRCMKPYSEHPVSEVESWHNCRFLLVQDFFVFSFGVPDFMAAWGMG